jgi:hypothetical protein
MFEHPRDHSVTTFELYSDQLNKDYVLLSAYVGGREIMSAISKFVLDDYFRRGGEWASPSNNPKGLGSELRSPAKTWQNWLNRCRPAPPI